MKKVVLCKKRLYTWNPTKVGITVQMLKCLPTPTLSQEPRCAALTELKPFIFEWNLYT